METQTDRRKPIFQVAAKYYTIGHWRPYPFHSAVVWRVYERWLSMVRVDGQAIPTGFQDTYLASFGDLQRAEREVVRLYRDLAFSREEAKFRAGNDAEMAFQAYFESTRDSRGGLAWLQAAT